MNDQTWFKLLLRGIGVLLIGLALPSLFSYVGWIFSTITQMRQYGGARSQPADWFIAGAIALLSPLLQGAMGVYLLLGARGLCAHCIRSVTGRCASCDYDVREITAPFCPECGAPLPMTPERHKAAQNSTPRPTTP